MDPPAVMDAGDKPANVYGAAVNTVIYFHSGGAGAVPAVVLQGQLYPEFLFHLHSSLECVTCICCNVMVYHSILLY